MKCAAIVGSVFLACLVRGSSTSFAAHVLARVPVQGSAVVTPAGKSAARAADALPDDLRLAEGEAPPRAVPLSELREAPGRALGRRVSFVLQFGAEIPDWNPFHSRFAPQHWASFSGWSDELLLWNRAAFEHPATRLFAPRGDVVHALLTHGRPYDRYRLTGVVREVFQGEPWIEIEAAERVGPGVGEGTLLHAGRALDLMGKSSWERAEQELTRALAAELPPHAQADLERLRDICRTELAEQASR